MGGGGASRGLGVLLLLPSGVLIGALMLYPIAHLVGMATVENGRPVVWQWGRMLARDAVLWTAVRNTLVFVVGSVTGEMVAGLAFALLLWHGRGRPANVTRGLILLPSMLSPTVVGIVWLLLLGAWVAARISSRGSPEEVDAVDGEPVGRIRPTRSVHATGRSFSWPSGCSTRSAWRP